VDLSVIICTYNPKKDYLLRVLTALQKQGLPLDSWELVVVDNNSEEEVEKVVDLSWHPKGRVVREGTPGLAHARIRGVNETTGEVIVFVDDDNILSPNYLSEALHILKRHKHIGSIGGKAIPEYELAPPDWFPELNISLGCRDLGNEVAYTSFYKEKSHNKEVEIDEYPSCAPIGTGMVIRREAFLAYIEDVQNDRTRKALGRTGKSLLSGEDNDIVLTLLKKGWDVGYFPTLYLEHIIPSSRLDAGYLARMAMASNLTWVIVLNVHGIRPWPGIAKWSAPLRKLKAYFLFRAWQSTVNYIKWKGICGRIEGQTQI